jgi:DNA-binding PadR family transcriptional regulator
MYGHEIMRTLSVSNAQQWVEISDKHVYHVLRRLEQRRFVTGTEEREERRPPRRRFRITSAGRRAFGAMLADETHLGAPAYSPFDTVLAMLAWGDVAEDVAMTTLRRRRALLAEHLKREHPPAREAEARFGRVPRAMLVKARLLLSDELRWLDKLIEEAGRVGWAAMRIRDDALSTERPQRRAAAPRRARKKEAV